MGKWWLRKGNLFETDAVIIAHGVNCKGVFGAGVAKQIAKIFPQALEMYRNKHFSGGWRLGDVQDVYCNYWMNPFDQIPYYAPTSRVVANLATQETYGRTGVHVNYEAVEKCFDELFGIADINNFKVAMPQIGCGLAGGKWEEVEKILERQLQKHNIEVEVWVLA